MNLIMILDRPILSSKDINKRPFKGLFLLKIYRLLNLIYVFDFMEL